ncbi:cobaltochelatase subunit CobN [Ardenticatena maritima]|uniref:Cobalt chelatase n=3 Tax=Ardenticatena maritima TaxID=872965 RepID=A0A0N8GS06_9CHLR|nr:cobaltochelatase subunit CobN [Ardenticatena maritima]KPL87962.1 cobalt chelatase [Ardenticatena maritima]
MPPSRYIRSRVLRPDGKLINVVHHRGHLMVCATGCCCGHTERGHAPVPTDLYHTEWERRKLRNKVHLTQGGCLGPCPLANVVLLIFDGRPIWFHSVNSREQILAIFDYIEAMLAADGYLPPPPDLADFVFDYYTWTHDGRLLTGETTPAATPAASARPSHHPAADIVLLSHADTDLLTLAAARPLLPDDFPSVDAVSLNSIKQEAHMQRLIAERLHGARVIIVRLLGRLGGVPGMPLLVEHARAHDTALLLLSGAGAPDPELAALSTVDPALLESAAAYLHAGGRQNMLNLLRFLADHFLLTTYDYEPPRDLPAHGCYHPTHAPESTPTPTWLDPARPTVGVLFYRAHWLSGNLDFVDALVHAIEAHGANALPVFTASLREQDDEGFPAAFTFLRDEWGRARVDVLLSTLAFAMSSATPAADDLDWSAEALALLDVPVVQAIPAGVSKWQWEIAPRGLNPLDTAMHVALPEFDGRIIGVPISFKEKRPACDGGCCADAATFDVTIYAPEPDRIARVVGLALRLAELRRTPNAHKRIAFVLTNSSGKAAKVGNAVGLDSPASLMRLFAAMREAGYTLHNLPPDGDTLIHTLLERGSYDETFLTETQLAHAVIRIPAEQYRRWFDDLPAAQREEIVRQWGEPPGDAYVHEGHICLPALDLGNALVVLQPPRGYGMDPDAIYHRPDLPPPHYYYALYRWLRDEWRAHAIVHMGKHGTLEWLPGKSVGLSAACYPDSFLGDMPLIYPFILNDPGEGTQAKRRAHAVIIDHLTPPITTADGYGELAELMQLVDEYYQVEMLDPAKLPIIQRQIWDLIKRANLDQDLALIMRQDHGDHVHEWDPTETEDGTPVSLAEMQGRDVAHLIEDLDGYLCELAGAHIRGGLHILGRIPEGDDLVDLVLALTRLPNLDAPSLRAALAATFGLALDEMLDTLGRRMENVPTALADLADRPLITAGDVVQALDELAHHLVASLALHNFDPARIEAVLAETLPTPHEDVRCVLAFICTRLVPRLRQTEDEIANLLAALDGRYVPAGPSGAPTRGNAHVLPTGRNFYAVDPRALPSPAAWHVGQDLAREVLERYRRETGDYPEEVGLSMWGTSAMRTHGDDVAQALALLGVRPVWHRASRRVVGVEVIPLEELGRPRVDVTVRISGFFRDAFPHLVALLDEAVRAVIERPEPLDRNFVRKHYLDDLARLMAQGLSANEAERRARYRIFGSKPGTYGAGILPLIEEGNWQNEHDFAEAYVNWGGYAYTADEQGVDARDTFRHRLSHVEVALHNQDNREHDIFDSDDYLQFHGGMIATIRALTGRKPRHYFGDTHDPSRVKVRDLREEVLRVYRTRVVNPKWLERIRQHGYKGGLEVAATVDYLFGYDATADVVDDWMYEEVAQRYALDPEMQRFLQQSNPWALQAISERLLEAVERGLWANPSPETVAALHALHEQAETVLEHQTE